MDLKLLNLLVLASLISGCAPSCTTEEQQFSSNRVNIEDLRVGRGEPAQKGDTLEIHYVGKLKTGKIFDSTKERGQPFRFTLGLSEVISGFDIGLLGMKTGGKRRLVIPPKYGFDGKSTAGIVPKSSTLFYEIELLKVRRNGPKRTDSR